MVVRELPSQILSNQILQRSPLARLHRVSAPPIGKQATAPTLVHLGDITDYVEELMTQYYDRDVEMELSSFP